MTAPAPILGPGDASPAHPHRGGQSREGSLRKKGRRLENSASVASGRGPRLPLRWGTNARRAQLPCGAKRRYVPTSRTRANLVPQVSEDVDPEVPPWKLELQAKKDRLKKKAEEAAAAEAADAEVTVLKVPAISQSPH